MKAFSLDTFRGDYITDDSAVYLDLIQDFYMPADPSGPPTVGFYLIFTGVTVFDNTWFTQVTNVFISDIGFSWPEADIRQNADPGFILRERGLQAETPESATMMLFGIGLVGLVGIRRRKS